MNDRTPPPIPLRADPSALREAGVTSLVRAILAVARRSADRNAPDAAQAWPGDRNAALVVRGAVEPTTPADAAGLRQISVQFVASLTPISAAARLIDASLKLTFGRNAMLSIPSLSLPLAAWIGDGAGIPVIEGYTTSGPRLRPHQLATSVVLSREMIDSANAEAIVRQVLSENVSMTLDASLFSDAGEIDDLRPAGILAGVPPIASTGDMVGDIAAIAEALAPVSGGGQPVLICAPGEAAALTLRTARDFWPVLSSAALATGTIIGLVPTALASVVDTPRVEASSQATVHMETEPSIDIGGGTATPILSTFQSDVVSIKFVLPASWALRSAAAVAWVENANWSGP